MAKKNKKTETVVVDAVVIDNNKTESPAPSQTPAVEQPVAGNGIRFDIPAPERGVVRPLVTKLVEAGPGACQDFDTKNAKSFQIGVIAFGKAKNLKFSTKILEDKKTVRVWYMGKRVPAPVAA